MTKFLSLDHPPITIPDTVPRTSIRKEGDFYLDKATLIAFDGTEYGISLVRLRISIHEDLFNHTLAGIATFTDSSDLPQFLPLIGEEIFKLRFTRPDESGRGLLDDYYEMEYRVFKMDGRKPQEDQINAQNYTLYFTSPVTIANAKKKVWQAWRDIPYSDMVASIYEEYLGAPKPINIEATLYEQRYCGPGYTPFQTIQMLAARSISEEGNGSSYVFFEDMDKFNYITIGKLLLQEPVQQYITQLSNVLEHGKKKVRDRTISDDVRNVENYKFHGSFDILKNMDQGMYSQRLIAVDILRQFHTVNDWSYKDEFDALPHLRDHDVCTDALDALGSPPTVMRLSLTTKDHDIVPWIVAREPGIKPNHIEEYLLKRASQMQQAAGNRIQIHVTGDPRRRVGQVVEYLVPNHYGAINEEHRPDPPFDRYLGGKFLIGAIKHDITVDRYYNEMELITDTVSQGIEGVDLIREQSWTW